MSYDLIEPTQKSCRLHRLTHWVTIIAVLSTPVFAYMGAIFGPTPYEFDPEGYLVIVMIAWPVIMVSPLYIAWIPFLIVRKWRLLGGIYLLVLSFFFIYLISYFWVTDGDTDNWGKGGSWIIYFFPTWILTCISGLLHIMIWWKERRLNSG